MKRRNFVLALIGSSVSWPFISRAEGHELAVKHDIDNQFKSMFTNPEHAREIGQMYLKANPAHANRDFLQKQIGFDHHNDPIKSFEAKRKHDFLKGNTVLVDGWMIANAEICVCALLAISAV